MANPASTRQRGPAKKAAQKDGTFGPGRSKKQMPPLLKYILIIIGIFVVCAVIFLLSNRSGFTIMKKARKFKTNRSTPPPPPKEKKQKHDALKELMNKFDKSISTTLKKAFQLLDQGNVEKASKELNFLAEKYPKSPLARYGKAQSLDKKADKERSNQMVMEAIKVYNEVSDIEQCPNELKKLALSREAERCNFIGKHSKSAEALKKLLVSIPEDKETNKKLGVQLLMLGRNVDALNVFKKVLTIDPTDGYAKSHIGFILKALDKITESIPYLEEGIHSGHEGADHGRYFHHLGDAYQKIGKVDEAKRIHEEGAEKGIFASAMQRSLYNADTPLKAQPWWSQRQTSYMKDLATLEANWKTIRDEAVSLLDMQGGGGFEKETEKLQDTGDWKQLTLFQRGKRESSGCQRAPKTCAIVSKMNAAVGCNRGQIKFSVMLPGTHVWPHTGPTNCRLRAHLGLVIPKNVFIRAGDEIKTWKEGKVIVFDDSFEHEVWHNGTSVRLILIIDFWHPELTAKQRRELTPI